MIRSRYNIFFLSVLLLFVYQRSSAQESSINNSVVSYSKKELNTGVVFGLGKEREELKTDASRYYEEQTLLNGTFRIDNKYWNLLDYLQEELMFSLELGPYAGFGDWIDSSRVGYNTADKKSYGVRTSLNASYRNRYYYDPRNYTVLDISGWGQYDIFNQQLDGTSIDSFGVSTAIDESYTKGRLRFGVNAKAGWGIGRLSPMNHLMLAHYLLEKYYPGRVFSDYEIARFAQVIADIKNNRDYKSGHVSEKEMESVIKFVNQTLLLESPELMAADWQYGEFDPRFEGRRVEMGPFFQYYNKEPDFIFGGYLQFDWAKYKNEKWNRNFSTSLTYSRYKRQDDQMEQTDQENLSLGFDLSHRDWFLGKVDLGWSYYSNMRSQIDFGVRYIPGLELNSFKNVGSISHNVVPYLAYYTQVNSKSRLKFNMAWRIADGEQFVVPGPEFSLAFYRSKY